MDLKKKHKLLHSITEGQLYVRNKTLNAGYTAYTCQERHCPARVYLLGEECFFSEPFLGHNHGKKVQDIKDLKVLSEIKENCSSPSTFQTTSQVSDVREKYTACMIRNQDSNLSFNKVARNLLLIHQKNIPKSPTNVNEIIEAYKNEVIVENYSKTKHYESNCYFYKGSHQCIDFFYSYFASDSIINNIKNNIKEADRSFLMDATFKVCPMGSFYQLLVIYIGYCNQATPFLYALMTRKTEACYKHLFQTLKENVFPLHGKSIMTDYETAMRSALNDVYPEITLHACWFHFTQAAKRKASQIPEFASAIKNDEKVNSVYYKLLAIPLLPASEILPTYYCLKSLLADVQESKKFLQYYEKQWLEREGPEKISVFKLSTRTTSALEAQNGILAKRLMKHGSFFKFVSYLIHQEYEKSVEFQQLIESGGSTAPSHKKLHKDWSEKIYAASLALERGEINPMTFLNRIVFKLSKICGKFDELDSSIIEERQEENNNEEIINVESNNDEILKLMPCIVCLDEDKISQITLFPCGHLKVCADCWSVIVDKHEKLLQRFVERQLHESFKPELKCPYCNSSVDKYVKRTYI